MPTATIGPQFNVADALAVSYGEAASVKQLKRRALGLLTSTRSWDAVVRRSAQTEVAVPDDRPATMLRRVPFDYGPETGGQYVEFTEADDDNCNLSW